MSKQDEIISEIVDPTEIGFFDPIKGKEEVYIHSLRYSLLQMLIDNIYYKPESITPPPDWDIRVVIKEARLMEKYVLGDVLFEKTKNYPDE